MDKLPCQTAKRKRLDYRQIWQGACVKDSSQRVLQTSKCYLFRRIMNLFHSKWKAHCWWLQLFPTYSFVQKIAAVLEKAHFLLFLVEISLLLEKPRTADIINIWKGISTASMSQFALFAWQSTFIWPPPPVQNNSSAHSKIIGRFWVICTKCHVSKQKDRNGLDWWQLVLEMFCNRKKELLSRSFNFQDLATTDQNLAK